MVYSDTGMSSAVHTLSDVLKLVVNLQQIASHPQLVEPCHVVSPFHMDLIDYHTPRLVDFVFDASKRDVSVTTDMHRFSPIQSSCVLFVNKSVVMTNICVW